MAFLITLYVSVIASVAGILYYNIYRNKIKKEKEAQRLLEEEKKEELRLREEKIARNTQFFMDKLDILKAANKEFWDLADFDNGYFPNYKLQEWKKKYMLLHKEIKKLLVEENRLSDKDQKEVFLFEERSSNGDAERKQYNKKFVNKEKRRNTHDTQPK